MVTAAAFMGYVAAINPMWVGILLLALAGAAIFTYRREWLPLATLVLACAALPAGFTPSFSFGGFTFPAYEIALLAAFVVALRSGINKSTSFNLGVLMTWLLIGIGTATIAGNLSIHTIGDLRNLAQLVMALVVAAATINTPVAERCAVVMKWVLWFSLGIILTASTVGIALAGRSEQAALVGESAEATRYLTAATYPALATLCICIALGVLGIAPFRSTWSWSLPSILILFLAFSRNHILGVVITVVAALIAVRSLRVALSAAAKIALAGATIGGAALIVVSPLMADLPGMKWAGAQVQSYSARVVEGIRSDTLQSDPSAMFRQAENELLRQSINEAPVFGHGFGYAYKLPDGKRGTWTYEQAPYYAHNFYLWATAKTGIVGLILFGAAVATPLLIAIFRTGTSVRLASAISAAALGFLAISFVAPMPLGSPTAATLGVMVGCVYGLERERCRSKSELSDGFSQRVGSTIVDVRQPHSVPGL
ncbi:O-antigen ligase family protein [Rhodococcus ruber]|uniref:O-antigen ligase family protein n=1 Tax=Rhodococcus ruber TaxID=1830 RepID=UPI0013792790|nr:O-antigen ligase family protein [Rhodococcus ruber]MDO1480755.1 O-antigen ligase family protein [Rhodococcus ruber]